MSKPSPHPRTKAPKRPKGFAKYTSIDELAVLKREATNPVCLSSIKWKHTDFPVAVIPCATAKAAKLLCKVANLTHGERVEHIQALLMNNQDVFISIDDIASVISALGFTPDKAEGKAP